MEEIEILSKKKFDDIDHLNLLFKRKSLWHLFNIAVTAGLFFFFSPFSNNIFTFILPSSGIWTRIIGVEDDNHADV